MTQISIQQGSNAHTIRPHLVKTSLHTFWQSNTSYNSTVCTSKTTVSVGIDQCSSMAVRLNRKIKGGDIETA